MPSPQGIRAGRAYVELSAQDSKLVAGLQRAQRRLRAFSASVRHIGMQLVKVSAVLAAPLVAGVKVFADFEQQLANVATMLDEPDQYMDRFRTGLRDLSVEFGESTETLAKGLYDILSASVPAEHALDVLAVAARAAQAGITDTGTAADAITTVLNAYGLAADQAGQVSDWLFSIVKRGKTTFAQLAPAIGNVATIAASAGVPLDEVGAALATMTRNGVQTDNAVTALNAIIASFLKPASEATAYARELGFEMSSATIRAQGLSGVFERIARLPPDAIAKLFPNIRAIKGVLPALKNMEGFVSDIQVMADRAGATETAYQHLASTLGHGFRQIRQAAMAALSVVGEALSKPVARVSESIRTYLGAVRQILERNHAMVVSAAKVVAVIGAVGGALIALGLAGTAFSIVLGGIAAIIGTVTSTLGMLVAGIGALLSPIGLAIASAASLGAVLLHATGAGSAALNWLGEQFGKLSVTAHDTWRAIGDAMAKGDIGLAARVLWARLKLEWQKGVHALRGYWIDFKGWFQDLFADAFYGSLVVMAEVVARMRSVWTRFTAGLATEWHTLQNILTKGWLKLGDKFDMFGKDFDLEYALNLADRDLVNRLDRIEREKKASLEDIEQDRIDAFREIEERAATEEDALARQHEQEREAARAALEQARADWQAAIDEVRAPATEPDEGPGKPETFMDRVRQAIADASSALEDATARTLNVAGTFQGMTAAGMGMGNVEERTAKATEETARNTSKIVQKMTEGIVFE